MCSATSIPSSLHFCKTFRNSHASLVRAAKNARHFLPEKILYDATLASYSISRAAVTPSYATCHKYKRPVAMACDADLGSAAPQDENVALEAVLKLYEAMKNRNISEVFYIIAEECLCVSNFVSAFKPFLGKKQVLVFFASLMKNLGNNIEFVVQQTLDDGMVVTVSWKLEWNNYVPLPLGKGFSFYICHVYHGKVMIKNVEIFLEPILHMESLRLVSFHALNEKLTSLVTIAMEKLNPKPPCKIKNKTRRAIVVLLVFIFAAAIILLLK